MITLEEQIISFETSQNLEGLKTETWRAVVNKFKGSHICIWLLSLRALIFVYDY